MRGTPRSSSSRRIMRRAGSLRSSASQTTIAASQSGSTLRASCSKFDRAGQVDEGEAVAEIIDRGDIGLDAGGVGARLGAGIADRGAVAHRTLARQGAGAGKNAFEQGGLAALERADERDQSRPADASVAVLGLAHGSRSFGLVWPVRLGADCRKYFTRRGKCQCFWRGGQASGLNPSRTKPIDRDQRRFRRDIFCLLEFSLLRQEINAG